MEKLFKNGLVIGRFQGLTNAHVGLINLALGHCENVMLFIGSASVSGTNRNPFTFQLRKEMILRTFSDEIMNDKNLVIAPIDDYSNESDHCHDWGRHIISTYLRLTDETPDFVIYGKEPVHALWYPPKIDNRMATLAVPRSMFGDVSATDLRWYITNDDLYNFKQIAPEATHDMFDIQRALLLDIPEYQELLKNRGEAKG